jgi:NTE family protein
LVNVTSRPTSSAAHPVGSLNGAAIALDPASAANRLSHVWARTTKESLLPGGAVAQIRTLQQSKTHVFPELRWPR